MNLLLRTRLGVSGPVSSEGASTLGAELGASFGPLGAAAGAGLGFVFAGIANAIVTGFDSTTDVTAYCDALLKTVPDQPLTPAEVAWVPPSVLKTLVERANADILSMFDALAKKGVSLAGVSVCAGDAQIAGNVGLAYPLTGNFRNALASQYVRTTKHAVETQHVAQAAQKKTVTHVILPLAALGAAVAAYFAFWRK